MIPSPGVRKGEDMRRTLTTRVTAVAAVALIAMLGIQGCSDDDKTTTSSSSEAPAGPVAITVTASEPSAGKYAFDVPATLDGGVVQIDFKNTGKEPHELQIVRVKDGTTAEQFVKDVVSQEEGAPIPDYVLGPAGGVGTIAPGTSATSTQKLDAGTYVYFCAMEGEAGAHYDNGQLGETTLTGDKGKGDLPKADGSIKAKEYGFELSGLKAGSNTVSFENTGNELHHALLFPLMPGATFDEAKAALASEEEPEGPPPIDFENGVGTAVIASGDKLVQTNFDAPEGHLRRGVLHHGQDRRTTALREGHGHTTRCELVEQ